MSSERAAARAVEKGRLATPSPHTAGRLERLARALPPWQRNCTRLAPIPRESRAAGPRFSRGPATRWRRNRLMLELLGFISFLLTLYVYVLVAAAVMSWLLAFNVVNPRNQFVGMVGEFLYRITEPVLRPIRNVLPSFGGLDLSPLVVIIVIWFIQLVILPVIGRTIG